MGKQFHINMLSSLSRRGSLWVALLRSLPIASSLLQAQQPGTLWKPVRPHHGGVDPTPIVTSVDRGAGGLTLTWNGLPAPYQVYQSPAVQGAPWEAITELTFGSTATIQRLLPLAALRVAAAEPGYVGSALCVSCHRTIHTAWKQSPHAGAWETLKALEEEENPSCLPCHTVGYGWKHGYTDEQSTAHLAGVQCENCHGPGVWHLARTEDPALRLPRAPAAELCGGCHNDFHAPTFDEWRASAHNSVSPQVAALMRAQGESAMETCGVCHSGSVRLAMLRRIRAPAEPLPGLADAADYGLVCAVCHQPHGFASHPAALRNPLFSTNAYSLSVAPGRPFREQYDAGIQVCGQCHNLRGARWEDTGAPPHGAPQYNLMVGQGGYDLGNGGPASHGVDLERQCVHCHARAGADPPRPPDPGHAGHSFAVEFLNCVPCHAEARIENFTEAFQRRTRENLDQVRALLDRWATSNAPAQLRGPYGRFAWEYTLPGGLSNPTADPHLVGPTAVEQAEVPPSIKQARLNLYLVQQDGSLGVHNPDYTAHLLSVARTNVLLELEGP